MATYTDTYLNLNFKTGLWQHKTGFDINMEVLQISLEKWHINVEVLYTGMGTTCSPRPMIQSRAERLAGILPQGM